MIDPFVADIHPVDIPFVKTDQMKTHNSQQRRLSKMFESCWAGKSLSRMQFGLLMRNSQ